MSSRMERLAMFSLRFSRLFQREEINSLDVLLNDLHWYWLIVQVRKRTISLNLVVYLCLQRSVSKNTSSWPNRSCQHCELISCFRSKRSWWNSPCLLFSIPQADSYWWSRGWLGNVIFGECIQTKDDVWFKMMNWAGSQLVNLISEGLAWILSAK